MSSEAATPPAKSDVRHHCIISGTGRAGTSFIMAVLTRLGLDTGFGEDNLEFSEISRSGLEKRLLDPNAPYIVKSPWICDIIEDVVAGDEIEIDHAFIPFRDLAAAAHSRIQVHEQAAASGEPPFPGRDGMWHTGDPGEQELVLGRQFFRLVTALGDAGIPMTFIRYPRLVNDAAYLYERLDPILPDVDFETFRGAFEELVRPDWVNTFTEGDR